MWQASRTAHYSLFYIWVPHLMGDKCANAFATAFVCRRLKKGSGGNEATTPPVSVCECLWMWGHSAHLPTLHQQGCCFTNSRGGESNPCTSKENHHAHAWAT